LASNGYSAGKFCGRSSAQSPSRQYFHGKRRINGKARVPSLLNRPLTTHPARSTGCRGKRFWQRPRDTPTTRSGLRRCQFPILRFRQSCARACCGARNGRVFSPRTPPRRRSTGPVIWHRPISSTRCGCFPRSRAHRFPSCCGRRRGRLQPARERTPPRGAPRRQRRQPRRRDAQLDGPQRGDIARAA